MSETPVPSVHESTFAKTDKTDAILVVDGKKLSVNKAILSYHSDYFDKLFNADSKEKSITELEIKNVEFEDFATLLSLVHEKPIMPTLENGERILELSDRFLMPSIRNVVEMFLISTSKNMWETNKVGWKYDKVRIERNRRKWQKVSKCDDWLTKYLGPDFDEIEAAFVETNKTDAILVVDGKKLHVNKAILSYHSDYFNVLFNSDFKEKSMSEIEIKDVDYADFAAFLSLVTVKPIEPLYNNFQKILELSDRFLMPSVKFTVEVYLSSANVDTCMLFEIAEEYKLDNLLNFVLFCHCKPGTERNVDEQIARIRALIMLRNKLNVKS